MAAPLTAQIKTLTKGKFSAYQAKSPRDIAAAQQLRARCFGCQQPHDCDAFDAISTHVLIKEVSNNTVVCCFRLFAVNGRDLASSYAAQFYELSALQRYKGLMMEMGRFCVHPDWCDPDILRVAWAAMTDVVDSNDVRMLFGCSSLTPMPIWMLSPCSRPAIWAPYAGDPGSRPQMCFALRPSSAKSLMRKRRCWDCHHFCERIF